MANRSSFQTPEQPSRVKSRLPEASPNFTNFMHALPDLTPPRLRYNASFGSLNPAGSSPQQVGFGFARLPANSTPERPNRNDALGKQVGDAAHFNDGNDPLGLRATPLKAGISSDHGVSPPMFSLRAPPMPIFHPSPRRASDTAYLSPGPTRRRSSGGSTDFGFGLASPRGLASPNMGQITSNFAAILDGHSRISPAGFGKGGHATNGTSGSNANDASTTTTTNGDGGSGSGVDASKPFASLFGALKNEHYNQGHHSPLEGVLEEDDDNGDNDNHHANDDMYDDDEEEDQHNNNNQQQQRGGMSSLPPSGRSNTSNYHNIDHPTNATTRKAGGAPTASPLQDPRHYNDVQRKADRRRALDFSSPVRNGRKGAPVPLDVGSPLLGIASFTQHSLIPASPICQPQSLVSVDNLLPIARLRDDDGLDPDVHKSPIQRRMTRLTDIDSPAVKQAANAAVAAALEARARERVGAVSPSPLIKTGKTRRAAADAAAAALASAGLSRPSSAAGGSERDMRHSDRHNSSSLGGLHGGNPSASEGPTAEDASAAMALATLPGGVLPNGDVRCNCKKSRCLKLYCDCFKIGSFCAGTCSCVSCANKAENADNVRNAREAIVQRNPLAFVQKIVEVDNTAGGAQHRRGCNCKKSKCLKKYCECFQAGIPCGEACKCESCHNTTESHSKRPYPDNAKRQRLSGANGNNVGSQFESQDIPSSIPSSSQPGGLVLPNGPSGVPVVPLQGSTGTDTLVLPGSQSSGEAVFTTTDGQVLVPIVWPLPGSDGTDGGATNDTANVNGSVRVTRATRTSNALPILTPIPPASMGAADGINGIDTVNGTTRLSSGDESQGGSSSDQQNQQNRSNGGIGLAHTDGTGTMNGGVGNVGSLKVGGGGVGTVAQPVVGGRPKSTPTKRKPARTMTAALE